jgi:hypothetical protein
MKRLTLFFLGLFTLTLFAQAQAVIRPAIAAEFGTQITVKAEFVAKSNDYYSQNMVREPYTLKVVAVNGRTLRKPVLIEYKLQVEDKDRTKIEQLGTSLLLEAYETVYQPPTATPWLRNGEQGSSFHLTHLLHIRPPQKNSP